jgi:hypothetical protein
VSCSRRAHRASPPTSSSKPPPPGPATPAGRWRGRSARATRRTTRPGFRREPTSSASSPPSLDVEGGPAGTAGPEGRYALQGCGVGAPTGAFTSLKEPNFPGRSASGDRNVHSESAHSESWCEFNVDLVKCYEANEQRTEILLNNLRRRRIHVVSRVWRSLTIMMAVPMSDRPVGC